MAKKGSTMSYDEAKWRAEGDARTIAQAEVIRSDPKRFKAASKAAENMYKNELTEATALSKLAKSPTPKAKKK